MAEFFTIVLLASLVLFIIGLVNPQTALFWNKNPVTRKKSSTVYGLAILVSLIGFGITASDVPPTPHSGDSDQKTDEPATKTEGARTEKPAQAAAARPKRPSPREQLRALARNCDTTFTYRDDSTQFDYDTGWVVAGEYKPWFDRDGLNMGIWEIPTYRTASSYDVNEDKKLQIYQKVRVRSFYKPQTKKSNTAYYTVSPMNSDEQYILPDNCFTVKNIPQCTIKQKSKNGFVVKATYKAPAAPQKRAHKGGGNTPFHLVDLPSGSIVLVLDYRPENDWMWGYVYTKSGKEIGTALFYESTLMEIR